MYPQKNEKAFTQSDWNMAQATLQRIDKLLQEANQQSAMRKYVNWFKMLGSVQREIYCFANEQERKTLTEMETQLMPKISQYGTFENSNTKPSKYYQAKLGTKLYTELDKYDKQLRIVMQVHGLLMIEKQEMEMIDLG